MKKAILLAGGKGSRLSPVTNEIPKPPLPLIGKSLIEHNLDNLKKAGVDDVLISLGYKAEMIRKSLGNNYSNINISYCEESKELGTAGALGYIKESFLKNEDEPILVLAADCIFDFDLTELYKCHKSNRAEVTIVTTESDDPIEFGIVLSDTNGRIYGFNEKPSWSQVFSDEINTGIYLIEPKIFEEIPKSQYDFSKDLFPKLLEKGKRMYSINMQGYWCDAGNADNYLKASFDAISGNIKGFPLGAQTDYDSLKKRGIEVIYPAYISKNATIGDDSKIGPNAVILDECKIGANNKVSGSIIMNKTQTKEFCDIRGTLVASNVSIGNNVNIEPGSVISNNVSIEDKSVIGEYSVINSNVNKNAAYFNIAYIDNDSIIIGDTSYIDYDNLIRISNAILSACRKYEKIGVMSTDGICESYARIMSTVLASSNNKVYDFKTGFIESAKALAVEFIIDCFIFIDQHKNKVRLTILNKNGLCPSRDFEKRLERSIERHGATHSNQFFTTPVIVDNANVLYSKIINENLGTNRLDGVKIAFVNKNNKHSNAFECLINVFKSCGGEEVGLKYAQENACLSIELDNNGGILFSQAGYEIDKHHIIAAILSFEKNNDPTCLAFPFESPRVYQRISHNSNNLYYPAYSSSRFYIPTDAIRNSRWINDEFILAAKVIGITAQSKANLSELYFNTPEFHYEINTINAKDGSDKMKIIRHFGKKRAHGGIRDKYEGITIEYNNGEIRLIPQKNNSFKVITESMSAEVSRELNDEFYKELNSIK